MEEEKARAEAYRRLAQKIVIQAARDFRVANRWQKDEILDFFYSDWCAFLIEKSPTFIIDGLLDEDLEEEEHGDYTACG